MPSRPTIVTIAYEARETGAPCCLVLPYEPNNPFDVLRKHAHAGRRVVTAKASTGFDWASTNRVFSLIYTTVNSLKNLI